MKRILFYFLLLFQVSVVLLVVLQYNLIDKYGAEITLITQPWEEEYYEDDILAYQDYTFEFEINTFAKDKWVGKEVNYQTPVFVLLKENQSGIYEIEKVTDKEIQTNKSKEIVLQGTNLYESEADFFHVDYGFETVNVKNHQDLFEDFKVSEQTEVTFKFAPWKQTKLIQIN